MVKYPIGSATVELTNRCNLACSICPVNNGQMKRKKEDLSWELFLKILSENPKLKRINLNNWGESMLHPNFLSMLNTLNITMHECRVVFCTNATLLTDINISRLRGKVNEIQFSVDGLKDSYERIRKGGRYDEVVRDIGAFCAEDTMAKTVVKMTVCPANEADVDEFRVFWNKKVDEVKIQPMVQYEEFDRTHACPELFTDHCIVLSNGTVVPCCVDYDGELGIGDVRENTLAEIWNGEKVEELRAAHINKQFPALCRKCKEFEGGIKTGTEIKKRFGETLGNNAPVAGVQV